MLFKEVIGQKAVKERLIHSKKTGRIAHAQLFFGPAGTGKLPLALAYAQYINCLAPGPDDSCGSCSSCIKYGKLAHPDLHFVYPVVNLKSGGKSMISDDFLERWREVVSENPYISENQWYEAMGSENKQGLISRNESNEVLKKLSLKSFEANYKVLLVWMAEKMNASAANTLLKLIEEPPPGTVFLMIAEDTDQILPTILSRTQMIRLAPLDDKSMHAALTKRFPAGVSAIDDVLKRANGNFSIAVGMMESETNEDEYFESFVFLMRRCYQRDIVAIQQWTEQAGMWGRERLKHFLSYCLRMIRENFILHLEQNKISYLSQKEADFSAKFSAFIHEGNVFSMAEEFEKAIDHIEANGYPRLVLLDLAVKNILLLKQPA